MTVVLQSCAAIGHIIAEPAHGIGAEIEMSHATGFAAGSTMRQVLSQTVHHEAQANTHIEQPIAANVITASEGKAATSLVFRCVATLDREKDIGAKRLRSW